MVHTFDVDGRYFALDADSGAVHMLDKMGFDAVSAIQSDGWDKARETCERAYGKGETEELFADIRSLQEQGLLFSYDAQLHCPPEGLGKPTVLKAMCLHVAHDCNLRCRYCFAGTGAFHGQRLLMPLEVGQKAIDMLIARSGNRKFLELDFFGGEPLMNFDVVKQLVAYGKERAAERGKTIRFTLTTNAYALTDEIIDFLNREMENVVLSIDGRKEVHDALRPTASGEGSYDVSLANAKKLAQARRQQKYYVRGTFTRNNLDFANDVMRLAEEGFEQISVEPVVLQPSSPYSLLEEHLPAILQEYDRLLKLYVESRKTGKWFSFFHFVVDLDGGPCIKKRLSGCGAGSEYVAVTPDGEIFPCHQFVGREGYRMGNVLTGELDEDIRAKFAANHVLAKEECASCWARLYCTGGCAANAQAFNGEINKPYEMECAMERKRLECAIAAYCSENASEQEPGPDA